MPGAPESLLLITVVLIVLALVYFLVSTIFALQQDHRRASTRRSPRVGEIVAKTEPVNAVVDDINANLDAAVDALEGLLVKKAGLTDAIGPRRGPLPGRGGRGPAQLPRQRHRARRRASARSTRKGTLTLARLGREAPIAAASPAGAGAAQRRAAAASRRARSTRRRTGPGPLARSSAPTPPSSTRHDRCRPQRRSSTSGRRASRARSRRCSAHEDSRDHRRRPQPAADDEAAARAARARLIDINDLTELAVHPRGGRRDRASARSPATSTCSSPSCSRAHFPLFRDAEQVIADPVVRNRGTIGGSLCQADAAEDLSAVCAALKADVVIRGADGERDGADGATSTSARGRPRSATARSSPRSGCKLRPGAGSAHEKVERRAGDWAIAAASAARVDRRRHDRRRRHRAQRGRADDDRPHPRRGAAARPGRRRRSCSSRRARSPSEDCSPIADGRGPVDYKRHLAGVLTKRALRRATARAAAGGLDMNISITINGETGLARRRAAPAARALHPRHARA